MIIKIIVLIMMIECYNNTKDSEQIKVQTNQRFEQIKKLKQIKDSRQVKN